MADAARFRALLQGLAILTAFVALGTFLSSPRTSLDLVVAGLVAAGMLLAVSVIVVTDPPMARTPPDRDDPPHGGSHRGGLPPPGRLPAQVKGPQTR
jgi:hypothetical protein